MSTLSTLAGLVLAVLGIGAMWSAWFFDQARRGERMIVSRRRIKAQPENIWLKINNGSTLRTFFGAKMQRRHLPEDPDIIETMIDFQGVSNRVLERVIKNEPQRQLVTHVEELNGEREPLGAFHWDSFMLVPGKSSTEVVLAQRGDFGTFSSALFSWYCGRRALRNLKRASEPAKPKVDLEDSQNDLIVSIFATVSFVFVWGVEYTFILVPLLVIHEYGHVLAMKMTGQPAPRMFLVPFFGGLAVGNHPHKSLFDDAFCSLMGPGLSLLPAIGLYLIGAYLAPDPYALWIIWAAGICGFMNALNLLPALPLDGGNIMRAVSQSLAPDMTRNALLVLGAASAFLVYRHGYVGFGMFAAFGLFHAFELTGPPRARPMSFTSGSIILTGYVITAGIHITIAALVFGWI